MSEDCATSSSISNDGPLVGLVVILEIKKLLKLEKIETFLKNIISQDREYQFETENIKPTDRIVEINVKKRENISQKIYFLLFSVQFDIVQVLNCNK